VEPTADPAALEAAARALRNVAQQLDNGGTTGTFYRQASGSSWTGHAATQFQNAVKGDWSKAKDFASELRAIAGLIDDGAKKVRQIRAHQAQLLKEAADKGVPVKPLSALPRP
jgi:uncharacterized protein YukE